MSNALSRSMSVSLPIIQNIANSAEPLIRISRSLKHGSIRKPHFKFTKSFSSSNVISSVVVDDVSQSGVERMQRILEHLRTNSVFLDSRIWRKFMAYSWDYLQYLSIAQRQLESISSSIWSRLKSSILYLALETGSTRDKSSLPRMKAICKSSRSYSVSAGSSRYLGLKEKQACIMRLVKHLHRIGLVFIFVYA